MKKKNEKFVKYLVGEEVKCTNTYGIIIKGEIVTIVNRAKIKSKKCNTFFVLVKKCNGDEQRIPTKYLKKIKSK